MGLLTKFVGTLLTTPPTLSLTSNDAILLELERVVRALLAHGVRQVLVQWKSEPKAFISWELGRHRQFYGALPSFQL